MAKSHWHVAVGDVEVPEAFAEIADDEDADEGARFRALDEGIQAFKEEAGEPEGRAFRADGAPLDRVAQALEFTWSAFAKGAAEIALLEPEAANAALEAAERQLADPAGLCARAARLFAKGDDGFAEELAELLEAGDADLEPASPAESLAVVLLRLVEALRAAAEEDQGLLIYVGESW